MNLLMAVFIQSVPIIVILIFVVFIIAIVFLGERIRMTQSCIINFQFIMQSNAILKL